MVADDELVVRQDSDMPRYDSIKSHIILSKEPSVLSISCGGRRCEIDLQAFSLRKLPEATLKVV